MEIAFPKLTGVSVKIATTPPRGNGYPTAPLQKGLILIHEGQDLSEEGLGFGVPLVRRGIQILYPGYIELTSQQHGSIHQVSATFTLDLEEKIAWPGLENTRRDQLYTIKYFLAAIIRRCPPLRGLLTSASNATRRLFGWKTVFEKADDSTYVNMVYTVDCLEGMIHIEVDLASLQENGVSEVFVMNEQGARYFDLYKDSDGTSLRGKEIGCWDKVSAGQASFISKSRRLAFTLQQMKGAILFRGRELTGSRLAWSGFGYSFPPSLEKISYEVRIERLQ